MVLNEFSIERSELHCHIGKISFLERISMDVHGLKSRAALALRTYEGRLLRAQRDHDDAKRALDQTLIDLHKAEAAYEAAKHVYQAGDADRIRDLGLDNIGVHTQAWIKQLLVYPHAGTTELQDAAEAVGWDATPAAIRQQAKRLSEKGVFTKVQHGVYRVSDRVRELVKDRLQSDAMGTGGEQEDMDRVDSTQDHARCDKLPFDRNMISTTPNERDSEAAHEPKEQSGVDDEYDDDLPF